MIVPVRAWRAIIPPGYDIGGFDDGGASPGGYYIGGPTPDRT